MFLEKDNSSSNHPYENSSSVGATFLPLDMPALIDNLKQAKSWKRGELNAIILLKTPVKKIVLTILHPGTEVRSFQADDSVTIQVIEGRLRLHFGSKYINLNKGELMTLREKAKYTIDSLEESALLLTLNSESL